MKDTNDGWFPDDAPVEVRYPMQEGQDRSAWPWLPGSVLQ